jgi:murein DD-endopeptidase MepM/ murein hydrolase activator NlpD
MKDILTTLLTLLLMIIGISIMIAGQKGPPAVLKFVFSPLWNLVKPKVDGWMKWFWMSVIGAMASAAGIHSLWSSFMSDPSKSGASTISASVQQEPSKATLFDYPVGDEPDGTPKRGLNWCVTQDFQDEVHYPEEYPATKGRHLGEDWAFNGGIGSSAGKPVFAVADGEVIFAGSHYSYGHAVMIRHRLPAGSALPYVVSLYGHLGGEDLLVVPVGTTVNRGQMIGHVGKPGENGKSKAGTDWPAHLHFELRADSSQTGFADSDISGGGWWGYHSPPTGFLNPTDRQVSGDAPGTGWIDRSGDGQSL